MFRLPRPDQLATRRWAKVLAVTDWQVVADSDFAVPEGADHDGLAQELAEALADPNPEVRDGSAYSVLANWVERGVLDRQLRWLGDLMADRFADPRVQARTFAPLVLSWVINRGGFEERWAQVFEQWYLAETDLRGYDERLGWLHAVAHGADLLGVLGRDERISPERMLELAARRMVADTEFVWRDQEDDRLGHAIALTLCRSSLTATRSVSWLDLVDQRLATCGPGPVPPFASNTIHTLRALYVIADRGVRAAPDEAATSLSHRDKVLGRLAESLATVSWFAG